MPTYADYGGWVISIIAGWVEVIADTFADHMDRLVAGNCAPSSPEGAKMLACTHPAFDGPVILFQVGGW